MNDSDLTVLEAWFNERRDQEVAHINVDEALDLIASFRSTRLERDQLSRDASDARRLLGICKAANVLHIARIDALEQAVNQTCVLLRWAATQPCGCEDIAYGSSGGPICASCAANAFLMPLLNRSREEG